MQDEYHLRQKRIFDLMRGQPSPATIPGFAGGTLGDQLSRPSAQSQQPLINPSRIGPAPIEDRDASPVAGTSEYDTAMAGAYPVSASGPSSSQPSSTAAAATPAPRLTLGNRGFSGDDSLVKLQTLRQSPLPQYGHLKGAGYGALGGIAANQGGTVGEKIGGALAGLITGGIKPNIAAAMKRDYEIKAAEQQAKQDQSLAQESAQTAGMLAQPDIQREHLRQQQAAAEAQAAYRNDQLEQQRQRNKAINARSAANREERKREADARRDEQQKTRLETERHHRELERQGGSGKGSKVGKYRAAQTEYESLLQEEKNALAEKDKAYNYMAQLKANPSISKEDIANAEKEADAANDYYRSFADKKRKAQTAIQENYQEPEVNTELMDEDAMIKKYAREHFGGNVRAARAAIEKQRKGQ